jgi:uncharacterized protein DUF262
MKIIDEVKKHRHDVHTDSYTTTWRDLISQYKEGDIIIDPEFQRLFRWDNDLQSKFIESLLLDIPIPAIFLFQNDESKYEIIDGLQRFCTLLRFFAQEIQSKCKEPSSLPQHANELNVPSILESGAIIDGLSGYTSETLPDNLCRTIKGARINVMLLEQDSSKEAKYEIFKRLNKYGIRLSDQEIRNVTGRLYGSVFPGKLKEIAANSIIREALNLKSEKEQKMDVEELILRFLAFRYGIELYIHKIDEFLDGFMIHASEEKFKFNPVIERELIQSFSFINDSIKDGKAFKFYKNGRFGGQFSTNLFDIVVSGVFENLPSLTPEGFVKKLKTLHGSQEIGEVTGAGSNTRKRIIGRIELGKKWFK